MNMSTPHEALQAFAKQTMAEQFVDEVTLLRMVRVRFPGWDPSLYGIDGTVISNRWMGSHLGTREYWDKGEVQNTVDIAHRFVDGSVAVRMKDTQRWEVFRTW